MSRYCARNFTRLFLLACICAAVTAHVQAFTADSLDITIEEDGDATAVFRFTLEGILENAIPQSVLEDELVRGLTTSSEPPELLTMDRSGATILMKKFAGVNEVTGGGMEYRTASMDFKKAQIALQNSALSSVITADFSPSVITVTFPDSYSREFSDIDALPSITHVIGGTESSGAAAPAAGGSIEVVSTPDGAQVYIDNEYMGNTPLTLDGIAEGAHLVSVKKDGFEPADTTLTITAGETVLVSGFLNYSVPETAPTNPTLPGFAWPAALLSFAAVMLALRSRRS